MKTVTLYSKTTGRLICTITGSDAAIAQQAEQHADCGIYPAALDLQRERPPDSNLLGNRHRIKSVCDLSTGRSPR